MPDFDAAAREGCVTCEGAGEVLGYKPRGPETDAQVLATIVPCPECARVSTALRAAYDAGLEAAAAGSVPLLEEASDRMIEAYGCHMSEQWRRRALNLADRIAAAIRALKEAR